VVEGKLIGVISTGEVEDELVAVGGVTSCAGTFPLTTLASIPVKR
jgi:hypothetical protein